MSSLPLATVLRDYRDGDEHGWDVEFAYLRDEHADRLLDLRRQIETEGITTPVLLGSNGRVWDGHHRLCVAHDLSLTSVPVEVAHA